MRYTVAGEVTISVYTVVEAESEEQAKELAMEHSMIGLCHQCGGGYFSDELWCTSGELDGEPQITSVEVEER